MSIRRYRLPEFEKKSSWTQCVFPFSSGAILQCSGLIYARFESFFSLKLKSELLMRGEISRAQNWFNLILGIENSFCNSSFYLNFHTYYFIFADGGWKKNLKFLFLQFFPVKWLHGSQNVDVPAVLFNNQISLVWYIEWEKNKIHKIIC